LPTYCLGVNAAIILYDITRPQTLVNINEWASIVRQKGGAIPITLVGTNIHLQAKREVSKREGRLIKKKNNLSAFEEVSAKTGQNVNRTFEVLVEMMLENNGESPPRRKKKNRRKKKEEEEFIIIKKDKNKLEHKHVQEHAEFAAKKVGPVPPPNVHEQIERYCSKVIHTVEKQINQYITLKLENGKTYIYVNGKRFIQCIRLTLNIQKEDIPLYDDIESIDEAAKVYKNHIYQNRIVQGPMAAPVRDQSHDITPEQEFWGHCSNLQAWVENDYDTRILMSNISFPLLRELSKVGDPIARRLYKEEIALRLESGYPSVVQYLLTQGYIGEFSPAEFETILESTDLIRKILSDPRVLSQFLKTCTNKFPTLIENVILDLLNLPKGYDALTSVIQRDIKHHNLPKFLQFLVKLEEILGKVDEERKFHSAAFKRLLYNVVVSLSSLQAITEQRRKFSRRHIRIHNRN